MSRAFLYSGTEDGVLAGHRHHEPLADFYFYSIVCLPEEDYRL